MKKQFLYFFVVIAVLFSSFVPSASAFAATNHKSATFLGLFFAPGGWTAKFSVQGEWKRADLKGHTLVVDGRTYPLSCNFNEEGQVACTMKGLGQHVGQNALIYFGGQLFYAVVPERVDFVGGFSECPVGTWETVVMEAYASNNNNYSGGATYPADIYMVNEGALNWVNLIESFFNVTIVSYTILEVRCELIN